MRFPSIRFTEFVPSLLVFFVSLTVYLLTLAPGITWAHHSFDGGELITASRTLGVAHPPGYPTYLILAHFFSFLPLGEIAWRYNLFSAVCVALAAAFVAATSGVLLRTKTGSGAKRQYVQVAAGLSFAFMPLVWGQATVTEVYALNLAVLSIMLWSLLGCRASWLTGLLLGLSITTHLTSLLMVPLVAGTIPRRDWPIALSATLLGLTPFLLIPFLAAGDSPVVWGDPTTPAGWWWLVSARLYQPNVFGVPFTAWTPRVLDYGLSFLGQFVYLGVGVLAAGVIIQQSTDRKLHWLMLLTVTLYAAYALAYDAVDAALYFLPGLLILSLYLAYGLHYLGWAAMLLPAALLMVNYARYDLSNNLDVVGRASRVLQAAPQDALLMSPGDSTIFALWYYQSVVGERPDIALVDRNLFAFDWYRQRLGRQYPDLMRLKVDDLTAFESENSHRPICSVSLTVEPYLSCASP